ncbi:uncharacterized protein STEHIDRAFT_154839 [Stereum hirsutum FP-91666 SS1]|uniref:uncharacterized protein n=1 Tax=Stereum hirsutum (strain FP-91666) TaxID=721885 RepID=UPI000440E502|nr:uncharacterized protein STEHIDRAFT_154839 [Stereum hirsutum FP-91666 SS1]EIM89157.1 hypothetical protein STEHIDRAFT_154839 [Stereum hirsutum FP-91666 SS1]
MDNHPARGPESRSLTREICVSQYMLVSDVPSLDPHQEQRWRRDNFEVDDIPCTVDLIEGPQRKRELLAYFPTSEHEYYPYWIARDTQAYIFVYSITDPDSLRRIHTFWDLIAREPSKPPNLVLLLLGNKADLAIHPPHALDVPGASAQVSLTQGGAKSQELGGSRSSCQFMGHISAKDSVDVDESVAKVVRKLRWVREKDWAKASRKKLMEDWQQKREKEEEVVVRKSEWRCCLIM